MASYGYRKGQGLALSLSPESRAYVDQKMQESYQALRDSSIGRMRDYDPPSGRVVVGETLRGWIVECEFKDMDGVICHGVALETDYEHVWYFKSPEGTLHRGPTCPGDNVHYADFLGYVDTVVGRQENWCTYRSNPEKGGFISLMKRQKY